MAMNKKEIAEVDALQARLAQATALRDLTIHAPAPVPPTPPGHGSAVEEFLFWANHHAIWGIGGFMNPSCCVGMGRRKGSFHSRESKGESWQQTSGVFYATRTDALLAVRDKVVLAFSEALAAIDAELAKGE